MNIASIAFACFCSMSGGNEENAMKNDEWSAAVRKWAKFWRKVQENQKNGR